MLDEALYAFYCCDGPISTQEVHDKPLCKSQIHRFLTLISSFSSLSNRSDGTFQDRVIQESPHALHSF